MELWDFDYRIPRGRMGFMQFTFEHKIFRKYPFFRFLTGKTEKNGILFFKRKRYSKTLF